MKSKTRVEGPFFLPEPVEMIEDPMKDMEFKPWQQEILDIQKGPVDDRKIYRYWELKGNTGKSPFTTHLGIHYNTFICEEGKTPGLAYTYNKENIVIFNFPRNYFEIIHL